MEPAPPPRAPAAGPGASPRRFRSARPSHGARAVRWGAPRLGLAASHVLVPQQQRTTRERGHPGTLCGRRLQHPTDPRDARDRGPAGRARLAAPHRSHRSQPSAAEWLGRERPGGSGRSCGERPAPRARRRRRRRSPAATAPRPRRQRRRRVRPLPARPGLPDGFSRLRRGRRLSGAPRHWAGGGAPRASRDPEPLCPGIFPQEAHTPSDRPEPRH